MKNIYSRIEVPCIPVSVNHYKHRARSGHYFVTSQAKGFKDLLASKCLPDKKVFGCEFEVEIHITLGPRKRIDCDNAPKLILDTISRRGMLRNAKTGKPMSDAHVTRLEVRKERGEHSMTTIEIIGVNGAVNP